MINHYPLWRYIAILAVLAVGLFFALPNLFGEDEAVQISALRGATVDEGLESQLVDRLKQFDIAPTRVDINDGSMLMRFANSDAQLRARDAIADELGRQYVVALNLAPATPDWIASLGALPMYLGLDLRGGVHFLMEVDMQAAVRQSEQRYVGDLKRVFRDAKLRYKTVTRRPQGGLEVEFADATARDQAIGLTESEYPDLVVDADERDGKPLLRAVLSEEAAEEVRDFAVQQNITTLRNRVNELGVAEPVIQRQGAERVVVQLPGVQDTARAKEILGATATLEFRMVCDTDSPRCKPYRERSGAPVALERSVIVTGDTITDGSSGIDQQSGSPAVFISLDGKGGKKMSQVTRDKIGRSMAVVFIEHKVETKLVDGEITKDRSIVEEVINVATIRDQLGNRFQITGLDSTEEARDLALLLRAGALAAPIEIIEERTVGPSLGKDNIRQGYRSVIIGFVLVLVFMALYYRVFGLVANLALTFNLVMIVAVLSLLQATLTLPGIAGIVLTVGMAVDANVLIFERIREELRNGNTPQASIHAGYEKAFSTIADANITTFIAAAVLFGFGTGPIKGFAITLCIGIATSMFTAIMGTRAVINLIYGGKRVSSLSI